MANIPSLPPPSVAVRRDVESLARWREAALGVHVSAIRHNLDEIMVPGPEGLVPRTAQAVNAAVLAGDIASKRR